MPQTPPLSKTVRNREYMHPVAPYDFYVQFTTLYGRRSQELQPRSARASDLCTF